MRAALALVVVLLAACERPEPRPTAAEYREAAIRLDYERRQAEAPARRQADEERRAALRAANAARRPLNAPTK